MLTHKHKSVFSIIKFLSTESGLHRAALGGHITMLKKQLEWHCELNGQDHDGNTALNIAAQCGHCDCFRTLWDAGGRIDILNKQGRSAFSFAQDFPQLRELIMKRQQLEATEESFMDETVKSP